MLLLSFGYTAGFMLSDVVADAIILECSTGETAADKGRMRTHAYYVRAVGMSVGALAGACLWNGSACGGSWGWGLTVPQLFWMQTLLVVFTVLPLVPFMYELPIRGKGVGVDLKTMWRETFDFLSNDGVWVPLMYLYFYNFCYVSNPAWTNFLFIGLDFSNFGYGMMSFVGAVIGVVGLYDVAAVRGTQQVDVAVAVDVGREDAERAVLEQSDDALVEGRVLLLVPRDEVVAAGAGDGVDVAVAVDVGRDDAEHLAVRDDDHPRERLRAVVPEERDLVALPRRGEDVDVAVAVDVDRKERARPVLLRRDGVFRERLRAVVLVPRDRVVVVGRREDVDVRVAVDVRGVDDARLRLERRHDALREGLPAVVLVPGDRVVVPGRRQHVHVAVAVHVDAEDAPHVVRRRRDEALREGALDAARVQRRRLRRLPRAADEHDEQGAQRHARGAANPPCGCPMRSQEGCRVKMQCN